MNEIIIDVPRINSGLKTENFNNPNFGLIKFINKDNFDPC